MLLDKDQLLCTSSTTSSYESKSDFVLREDKSLSLAIILKKEIDFQNELNNSNNDPSA